ncbi:hypothetical protein C7M84_001331 [Penaeus vannamei]|uniref:Uncharacterized protein n=1 Tax=Penaeus vannamei TaxID=6689 RepID=A0A423TU04_PENVA|nr:hypothetical protein C7M84_001331 [Penaeus vannamei]
MPDREDPSSLLYPRVLAPLWTPALQFVKEGYTVLNVAVAAFFCHETCFRCHGNVSCPSLATPLQTGVRQKKYPCHGTGRFWSVHGSMYAYVPSTSFCLVFHVARAAPSETDVRQKNSRVTVPAIFGPCTGPCTRTCIVRRFAQFFMSHVQLLHGTGRFWSVHGSMYAYVPSTSFCLVFHVARAAPSETDVRQKNSRVTVPAVFGPCTGPCTRTCIVRRFAQFFMSHVQLLHGTGRFWSVHGSMYAYVPSTSFCPVFHVARAAPSQTGVRQKNSRVTVTAVFDPCTGPCTRTCIVRRFAQFSMSHVQLLHGTVRFWSVHGSMYTYVPSTSFCPVFNVARAPSQTGVRQKNSRVTVTAVFGPCTGPCTRTCIVRRFAQFSMSHVQLLHKRASGQKVHVSWYRPSFPWVHGRSWSVYGSMYAYVARR